MAIWDDVLTNTLKASGIQNTGVTRVGDKVWDANQQAWIQEGNVGDPQQVLQNRSAKSELAQNYLNWNSDFNNQMRTWLKRMFSSSVGGADSMFASGLSPSSGIGTRALSIARAKAANDAAQTSWQQYMGGQQLGVQAQLAWDKDTMDLRQQLNQRQMFNDEQKNKWTGDILGGIADLGITAATGGFGGLFGGGGSSAGFVAGESEGITEDAQGNIRYTGALATPNVPSATFRRDLSFSEMPTASYSVNGGAQKQTNVQNATVWGDALKTVPTLLQRPSSYNMMNDVDMRTAMTNEGVWSQYTGSPEHARSMQNLINTANRVTNPYYQSTPYSGWWNNASWRGR